MMRKQIGSALVIATCVLACGPESRRKIDAYGSDREAVTQCPGAATVAGIDVSDYQPGISWAEVAGSGIQFAYAKATEGLTITDSEFANNWSGMQANGVLRGAYHYFHSADSGTAQADAYLAVVGTLGQAGDLPPMLDWESMDSGTTTAQAVTEAQNFINEIKAKTGLTTVIYTYPDFWDSTLGNPAQFSVYPFWIANYATSSPTTGNVPPAGFCPELLAPWSTWTLWQWSSTGSVPSVTGDVDMDVYNGTLSQLTAWANDATPTPDAGSAEPDAGSTSSGGGSGSSDAGDGSTSGGSTGGGTSGGLSGGSGSSSSSSGCSCSGDHLSPALMLIAIGRPRWIRRRRKGFDDLAD